MVDNGIPLPSPEKIAAIARAKGMSEDDVRAVFEGNVQLEAGEPIGTVYREDVSGDTASRVINGGIPMWQIAHLADGLGPAFVEGQLAAEGWTRIYPPAQPALDQPAEQVNPALVEGKTLRS